MITFDSNSDYENKTFPNVIISTKLLEHAEFYGCTFDRCSFDEATLQNCVFENCNFKDCNFNMSHLVGTRLTDCSFSGCKMTGIDWTVLSAEMGLELSLQDCDMSYSLCTGVDLSGSRFIDSVFQEVDFSKAQLRKASFRGSDLARALFEKTNLRGCDFRGARNYCFDPSLNFCKGALFDRAEVINLLQPFDVVIE